MGFFLLFIFCCHWFVVELQRWCLISCIYLQCILSVYTECDLLLVIVYYVYAWLMGLLLPLWGHRRYWYGIQYSDPQPDYLLPSSLNTWIIVLLQYLPHWHHMLRVEISDLAGWVADHCNDVHYIESLTTPIVLLYPSISCITVTISHDLFFSEIFIRSMHKAGN